MSINTFKKNEYKYISIPLSTEISEENIIYLTSLLNNDMKRSTMIAEYDEYKNEVSLFIQSVDLEELTNIQSNIKIEQINFYLKEIIENINSIGSYGIKDGKRVFVGFNRERKVKNRKQKEEQRTKYFYALDNNFSKKNNELSDDYINKIICDDSESILSELPDNCIDLVFTSPPYNFGLDYDNHKDESYWENYFEKLFRILDETVRVLKFGGRLIINIQPLFSDYIPSHHIVSNYLMEKKLIWKGEVLWEKNNYNCKYTAWGSWKSPSSPYLKYTWEFIEIFMKGSLTKKGSRDKIDITADEFKEWVVAKWSVAPERKMKKFGHPAMFPEELARRAIKLFSYQGDIILDPFMGVGTTCLVAKKLQRKYLGIDISKEYCDVAENRVNEILL